LKDADYFSNAKELFDLMWNLLPEPNS